MIDGWYWLRLNPSEKFERIVSVCRLDTSDDYLVNSLYLSDMLRYYPNLQLAPVEQADSTKAFIPPSCKGVNLCNSNYG